MSGGRIGAPWRIRHIDLADGVPALGREEGQGVGRLVVYAWWRGIPLGSVDILAKELPLRPSGVLDLLIPAITPAVGDHLLASGFSADLPVPRRHLRHRPPADLAALLALDSPLDTLAGAVERSVRAAAELSVSVVVCTRDRPAELRRCLDALGPTRERLRELIVVDNGPTAETRSVIASYPWATYLAEPRPGLSIARNAGVARATADIVAFTDDDAVVAPTWAERIVRSFTDPRIMAATGLVLPAELETEPQIVFERGLGGFGRGFRAITFDAGFFARMRSHGVPVWRIGAGANMACRREAFALVGPFDERLGPGAAGCGDDSELWYRILAAGWTCRYDPVAVAHHRHRRTWAELERQAHAYMRGHVAALLVQHAKHGDVGNLKRLLGHLPLHYGRLAAEGALAGFGGRYRLLGREIAGCFSGLGAVPLSDRSARGSSAGSRARAAPPFPS